LKTVKEWEPMKVRKWRQWMAEEWRSWTRRKVMPFYREKQWGRQWTITIIPHKIFYYASEFKSKSVRNQYMNDFLALPYTLLPSILFMHKRKLLPCDVSHNKPYVSHFWSSVILIIPFPNTNFFSRLFRRKIWPNIFSCLLLDV
jgi:hypothetical protein